MKAHESSATDRHGRRCAGHHVMIAAAVVGILVADGADDAELVEALRQQRHRFTKMGAGDAGGDGFELTADVLRGGGLRVKGLVVRGAAIQPDEDAVHVVRARESACLSGLRTQAHELGHAESTDGSEASLEEVTSRHTCAVGVNGGSHAANYGRESESLSVMPFLLPDGMNVL